MNPFSYVAPTDAVEALAALGDHESNGMALGAAKFIAGGTNLLDLMKENVMRPARLIDINGLPYERIEETASGGLMLGALARNADTAYHPAVRSRYPLLSAAILAGASPQLRNMATNGGNLLQRTRCYYFYDSTVPCNKREPGTGCSAIGGLSRQHAILGASEHCIATHPSDMCVALAALGAIVHVQSPSSSRQIPFADFHRLPGDRPDQDTHLAFDELITHVELPEARGFAGHSVYLKIRERASYAFALVSVAAALELAEDGSIRQARLALGGVAHKPWRDTEVEQALMGAMPSEPVFAKAADALLRTAHGQGANDFKIPLAHRAIVRALSLAVQGTVTNTGERLNGEESV
ncbi:xanthine dehydrogenase family protein subunit M [Pseudomonas sp. RIT-PI-S]|uniref:FAD binding domain-containing protein n=1 Tax=Pseudomonas sp. RIT-PI-S TaxID=3035295 RepID=UPI0021D8CD63|nr:xanthine dehydrogenase family protein subunit M [Pseudomonas sp. RIT-PI-S]